MMYLERMTKLLLTLLAPAITTASLAQDLPSFEKKEFLSGGDTLRYRIQYPLNYRPGKKYPVILFLHGSGERGSDNNKQLFWGGALFADTATRKKFPSIIVVPQCPLNDAWPRITRGKQNPPDSLGNLVFESEKEMSTSLRLTGELLDQLVQSGQVKEKQVYIGGLSLGGMGTFELLWRKPGFFAAAFPICGGGDPQMISRYGPGIRFWVFHGEKDPVVTPAHSRRMVDELSRQGYTVKYSEYPGVMHDSWKNAFAEPELFRWLFRQKRRK